MNVRAPVADAGELLVRRGEPIENRILTAARSCFYSLGASKTSIIDVARVAGVSRATIYKYFPTKQILMQRVQDLAIEQDVARLRKAMDREPTLAAQLAAAVRIACRLAKAGRKQSARSTFYFPAAMFILESPAAINRMVETLVPYLEAAAQRGEVRATLDRRQAAEWITYMMISVATLRTVGPDTGNCDEVATCYCEYAMGGLR